MNTTQKPYFKRVLWIVMDGVGAGALPDASKYGDSGSNTLGNLSQSFLIKNGRPLALPGFQKLGIGSVTTMEGIARTKKGETLGAWGRAKELSLGKDTTSGHWEMAGLVVKTAFATFPNGFPESIISRWCLENGLPGVLGNKTASGTEIIEELGHEHLRTGKPILYTSADSVWQVAAHEDIIDLKRLDKICRSARTICDELSIGRVISRPFIHRPQGSHANQTGKNVFIRTYNRKDYSQIPPVKTYLTHLCEQKIPTLGIGKISNIYAAEGIQKSIDTKGNQDGFKVVMEQLQSTKNGLIYCNLIDFDMLYGHRRDITGFGHAMEALDLFLPTLNAALSPDDLVILTADHGNDPTFRGSDHTREFIPILAMSPRFEARAKEKGGLCLGDRDSFADIGATVYHALTGQIPSFSDLAGVSFLKELV